MSRVRGRDTKPEITLKKLLKNKGYIYQPKIYGRPDFINYEKRIIIFLDGCFWHKCPNCFVKPATNKNFWEKKISGNVKRDIEVKANYENSGWNVIRIWEHELKRNQAFINSSFFKSL